MEMEALLLWKKLLLVLPSFSTTEAGAEVSVDEVLLLPLPEPAEDEP